MKRPVLAVVAVPIGLLALAGCTEEPPTMLELITNTCESQTLTTGGYVDCSDRMIASLEGVDEAVARVIVMDCDSNALFTFQLTECTQRVAVAVEGTEPIDAVTIIEECDDQAAFPTDLEACVEAFGRIPMK